MVPTPRLLLDSLKRCPLCEAANAESSDACFVCGWSGVFDREAEDLQASIDDIVSRCPELMGLKSKPSWWSRWRKGLRGLLGLHLSF